MTELSCEQAVDQTAFSRFEEEEEDECEQQHEGELIQRLFDLVANKRMHDGQNASVCVTSVLCLFPGSCYTSTCAVCVCMCMCVFYSTFSGARILTILETGHISLWCFGYEKVAELFFFMSARMCVFLHLGQAWQQPLTERDRPLKLLDTCVNHG